MAGGEPTGRRRQATEADRGEALRLAGYGDAPGFLAVLYSLRCWPRRRKNERLLRRAVKSRQQAYEDTEAAFLELGRRIHQKSHEVDLSAIQMYLHKVDHAVLHADQVSRGKRTKQEKALAGNRADQVLRELAERALEAGLGDVDRDGASRVAKAVDRYQKLDREVHLRELGIDEYDEDAVQRGAIQLIVIVALGVVAAFYAALR